MKKLLLLSLLTFSCTLSYAQGLYLGSYVEKTNISPKLGTRIGYEFREGFSVEAFYQKEAEMLNNQEIDKPRFYEKEFYGVAFGSSLLTVNRLNLNLNIRTGVSNKNNFAITPSLLADYEFIKNVHINGGLGVRMLSPTFQGGLRVDLF